MSELRVPIHNPDGKFKVWLKQEIFTGTGDGRYVPNVDDAVWDWQTGLYRVVSVNTATGLSVLEPYVSPTDHGPDPSDFLIGGGRDHLVEDFRVYIDTSVVPHSLAVDNRRLIYGTTKSYAKLFLGTDIGDDGTVISAMYDQSGNFLGENIPLEVVSTERLDNIALKVPMVGYTNHRLEDNEILTCVVYSDDGHATDVYRLVVKNTAFIRTADAARRYVMGIHLESPFLSSTDHRTLEFPINMPIEALPLTGVVTYSDGKTTRLPMGGKFQLYGTDNYIATIEGQRLPLALSYRLSEDEFSYGATAGDQHYITERYWATTKEFEETFSVKLFTFPNWVDPIQGYQLEHYLFALDRQEFWNVTDLVKTADNSAQFNPLLWGSQQSLTLELEMGEVSRRFPTFRHIQTVDITLLRSPHQRGGKWTVGFSPNQQPPYGPGVEALLRFENVGNWKLDLRSGEVAYQPWIEKVFFATEPLFHNQLETDAPNPNVVIVWVGNNQYEIDVVDFDKEITVPGSYPSGKNIYLQFIYRTHDNDLQLGMGAMPLRRLDL